VTGFRCILILGILEFPHIRAQATEGIMAVKIEDAEFSHPEAVADLRGLRSRM